MLRALEQFINNHLPRAGVGQLRARGRQANEIEIKATQANSAFGQWLRLEPARRTVILQQHIDRIPRASRQRDQLRDLKRPMRARIRFG